MGFKLFSVFLSVLFFSSAVEGAHILALFSSLSFADHSVFRGYVSLLAQNGHSVVVMTPYPGQFQTPAVQQIVELNVGEESAPLWEEFKMLLTNTDDYYTRIRAMNEYSLKLAIAQLKSKQMTALLLNPNIKFDLVITEADVPLLYAVAEKYQAPHIAITTSSGRLHQYEAKGVPVNPTLYPDVNTLNYGQLSTWKKVSEILRYNHATKEYYNHYLPLSDLAAKKVLGLQRDLLEVEKEIDLLFVANSPLLIGNRPVVPSVVFVDRMQMTPGFSLPQDLQVILDAATKGIIYFSIGAIQESEQLSPALLQTLTDAFKELPYTVLWKIANTTVINKPDNVITSPWFPQQQVLAHPNVKAFITHGGSRSLEEAVFYQVPIVGLPVVQSRKVFIGEVTKHGAGELLDTYYLNKEELKKVLTKVANDSSYKKSITKLRKAVVDPTVSGPEKAVFFTEYVLRNGGARELRSTVVFTSFIKDYLLDILTILLLLVSVVGIVVIVLLRIVVRRVAGFSFRKRTEASGKFKAL